ncbi:hypothetical protein [Silvibacterium bohemicum]|uniref:hypothetical protein n=1 Tax=Silvibacterium bohemicum TaxID=1577686 RepID=UPI00161799B7|nr:hypothetical protein [Silvibacterium bohemicum]
MNTFQTHQWLPDWRRAEWILSTMTTRSLADARNDESAANKPSASEVPNSGISLFAAASRAKFFQL